MQEITLVSVNVGRVREVAWSGRKVQTGIFKSPVDGPIRAAGVNLEGDDQADRTVHGGPDKAIYAFPSEHYPSWREAYNDTEFGWGAFGENFTTRGIREDEAIIGSVFRCGDLHLRVTEPRMPCYKLAIRLGQKSALRRMLQTGHTGFYFAIAQEGLVQAGDLLQLVSSPLGGVAVTSLTELYRAKKPDQVAVQTVLQAPGVPESWRTWLENQLN